MAEREIVLHGVVGIELAQLGRDFLGSRPTRGSSAGQSEIARDSMNVGVDRDDEVRRRNGPETEVDPVGRPNHPSGVEDQALARAAGARVAHEMTHAAIGRRSAKRVRELGETFAKHTPIGMMIARERFAERAVLPVKSPRMEQHRCDVLAAIDPMYEALEQMLQLGLGRLPNARRRAWTEPLEYALDAVTSSERTSEGEARGYETDDLTVFGARISMDEVHRITPATRCRVRALE